MGLENLSQEDLKDLFEEPINKETIIITITDREILQLLKGKEVYIGDTFNTIIIKYIGDIK